MGLLSLSFSLYRPFPPGTSAPSLPCPMRAPDLAANGEDHLTFRAAATDIKVPERTDQAEISGVDGEREDTEPMKVADEGRKENENTKDK